MILNNIKSAIEFIKRDRFYLVLLVVQVITGLWVMIDAFLTIRTSQLQIWFRFTSFGAEAYNRANWTYSYAWVVLALIIALLHIILSIKFLKQNYRELSLLVLGFGEVLLILASANFNMIMALPG